MHERKANSSVRGPTTKSLTTCFEAADSAVRVKHQEPDLHTTWA